MVQNMGASKSFVQQLHCTHTELSGGCVYAGYINSWEKPKETHFTVSQKGFTVLNLCLPSAGVPVCKELSYGGQGGQQYASWDQSTHYMCYVSNTNFPNSELGTNVKKYLTSLRMAGNWWAELERGLSWPEHNRIVFKLHRTLNSMKHCFLTSMEEKVQAASSSRCLTWRQGSQPAILTNWGPRKEQWEAK